MRLLRPIDDRDYPIYYPVQGIRPTPIPLAHYFLNMQSIIKYIN